MHARAVMQKIGELYAVEKEARELGLYADARRELRRSKSLPLLEPLRELILSARDKATPKSNLGKACQYALKLWGRLLLIFEDGRIEIDNNMAENAMRPVALGRKNWLHVGSEKAGPKLAALASVVETCKRHGIDVPGLSARCASQVGQLARIPRPRTDTPRLARGQGENPGLRSDRPHLQKPPCQRLRGWVARTLTVLWLPRLRGVISQAVG